MTDWTKARERALGWATGPDGRIVTRECAMNEEHLALDVHELLDLVENNTCARHADQRHGAEAEELRAGIERLIKDADKSVSVHDLQRLLDEVDARDSLAYLEARDEKLAAANAEIERLTTRRDELLATIARISQSTPLDEEVKEALNQRGALLAEVGTLRARVAELERQLNTPHTANFLEAVTNEVAHQVARCIVDHDKEQSE